MIRTVFMTATTVDWFQMLSQSKRPAVGCG
jgi:hypothetical protein